MPAMRSPVVLALLLLLFQTALVAAPRAAENTSSSGIAAPLYAVTREREFQWTFPQGTRIRFVDCDDSKYPTSDFRCSPPGARLR